MDLMANGAYTKPHRLRKGELNSKASLTNAQAANVKMLLQLGSTLQDVADWFGVSKSCINHIRHGRCRRDSAYA